MVVEDERRDPLIRRHRRCAEAPPRSRLVRGAQVSRVRRTTHLIAISIVGNLALLGTNSGQRSTLARVLNLEAEPRAGSPSAV